MRATAQVYQFLDDAVKSGKLPTTNLSQLPELGFRYLIPSVFDPVEEADDPLPFPVQDWQAVLGAGGLSANEIFALLKRRSEFRKSDYPPLEEEQQALADSLGQVQSRFHSLCPLGERGNTDVGLFRSPKGLRRNLMWC